MDSAAPNRAHGQPHREFCFARPIEIASLMVIPIRETESGATFAVKVHPRAKKNAINGEVGDAIKVALTAPPIDGKANAACTEFFAKLLKVPRASVNIASGAGSRNKVVRVNGLSAEQVRARLAEKK
jgi:uncharacterized protein (TIGR00251 family)